MLGPCGRTIRLRSLVIAASSRAGIVRVRSAICMPRRNSSLSPLRVVHVTSNCVAPTLANASSIRRASLCVVLALSSATRPARVSLLISCAR